MLTIKGKQYRNLQEQVLQNQDSIEILKDAQGIADLGIRVIQVEPLETPEDLPTDYTGDYGDAYLVGLGEPYELYVWTRSNQAGVAGYWFDWGKLNAPSTVPGPVGPQGIQGETGTRGSLWNTQSGAPTQTQGVNNGDQALDGSTGNLYQFSNGNWQLVGNIMGPQGIQGIDGKDGAPGPQGIQGIQGPKGEQGEFIQIIGNLDSVSQLPPPNTVPRYSAYLIPENNVQHIYLIVGETTLSWYDAGGFGGGTAVIVNGLPVSQIDMTNTIIAPEYGIGENTETTVRDNGVDFTNITTNGNNIVGDTAVAGTTNISLPIVAGTNIQPVATEEKGLAFDLTEEFYEGIDERIENAKPMEVQILAPETSVTGQLTEEQLATLQGSQTAFLKFNNEIYRLQDVENVTNNLVYTHIGYNDNSQVFAVKSIVITISTRVWKLRVTGNQSLSTAQFSYADGILTITND